jgi:hypothetical protein
MCEHLKPLEEYIKAKNIQETFSGKAWRENCNEWIYYDCVLDIDSLKTKLQLDDCVEIHDYIDIKVANELGFYCTKCKDGIMGFNTKSHLTTNKITVS